MVWRWVRIGRFDAATLKRIDFIGLIGLAVFLIFLEVFLEEGPEENWFASAEIWAYLIVCVLGGMLFFYRALTRELPIVDLRPLMVPTFAIGVSLGFVLGIAMFGPIFLQPLFLGQVRQLNAEQIGHMLWAQGLTMMVMAPIMGRFARALPDLRPLGFAGFVMVAVSCYMQTTFTAQTGFSELLWPQILRGAGMMLTFMSVMQPALQSLPAHIMHAGTGLFNLVRNLGGALGLAILGTVQTQSFAFHRQELYSGARLSDPYVGGRIAQNEAFLEGTGAAEPHRQAIMQYVSLLDREAFVMSFNDQFLLIAALAAASACFMIFMRRAPGDMTGQGAR
jgi:DHA2 family multidrug resistance protein